MPAETTRFRSPIPTQSVSSDEFFPAQQSPKQKEFEARVKALGTTISKKLGRPRRRFFQGAAGMAAAFVAMKDTFGPMYLVSRAEAQTPELANVCVHKGLFPDSVTRQYPNLADHANVNDVARVARERQSCGRQG